MSPPILKTKTMTLVKRRRVRLPKPPSLLLLEQGYAADINLLLKPIQVLVRQILFPVLEPVANKISIRTDDESDLIDDAVKNIRSRYKQVVNKDDAKRTAGRAAQRVNKSQSRHHNATMRTVLGVDPVQAEPWLKPEVKLFVNENASLITTIPEDYLTTVEQMVYQDSKRKLSPPQMRANIVEQFGVSEGRAKVIARDQVSKFNGRLTELRQVNAGIKSYVWMTSKDGRVRSSHAHLDGEQFNWDEPPVTVSTGKRAGERNHPGQDIQCRCLALPVVDDLI